MSTNASHHPANKAVEKAIVDKGLGKKCAEYSDVASFFVLFHVARASRMTLPCARGGNLQNRSDSCILGTIIICLVDTPS